MTELSVEQAAQHLAVSDVTVYAMIRRRELSALGTDPVRLALADVEALHQARRVDALRVLERRRRDPVALAREVCDRLHPRHLASTGLPGEAERQERFRLSVLPSEARTLFGGAALKATAAATDGCRWCLSREFAAADGGWAPAEYREAFAVLLGEPCKVCGPRLYGPVMAAARADVHQGGVRPSGASARSSVEDARLAAEWVRGQPVTAAVKPAAADDGRAMVARRRRDVQAKLKAARRRGDTRHALQLQQQLQALTADAAVVDGRAAVAASARPGTLRCGHRLDERCSCPRRASR